jgi:DNA segregation ATPase FtsK/SpoIIIE, S-DNA-T family
VAVLGTPDAYHLPAAPGGAFLKVDADAPTRFGTALVGAHRRTPESRPAGDGPAVVPFTPTRPAPVPPSPALEPTAAPFPAGRGATDLDAVVAAVRGAGRPVHQVWLPPLEPEIPLERLDGVPGGWLRVPVGMVDRPLEQAREPLLLDFSGGAGHLAVVGAPRTGKSTLLCTIVAALAAAHPPGAVQLYAIDLGGGLLHRLAGLPHVGAVCGAREPERARRLVRQLRGLVAEREVAFRGHGIDSMAAWHRRRRDAPGVDPYGEVFVLVDNWGQLRQELDELTDELGELAATGLHHGVHLVLSANRWADLRPGLRDNLGGRLELRLNDPVDSELSRSGQLGLPDLPGRGLTPAGLQFQAALPGPVPQVLARAMAGPGGAPPLRMLPALVSEASLPPPGPGSPAAVPFAVDEDRLEPVWLDLFAGPPHLLVLGDGECGKTGLLRLLARGLAARHRPDRLSLLVIDPRRTLLDLAGLPHLEGYATAGGAAVEAAERLRARLADRLASSSREPVDPGRRQVVLVDDYQLLLGPLGGPLDPLLELLGRGGEVGLHVVLARSVAGAARTSFEPVYQRLCELGGPGLVMNGDPGEGPLLGGQRAARLPPGRGFLVRRRHPPTLVQVAHADAGFPQPTGVTG